MSFQNLNFQMKSCRTPLTGDRSMYLGSFVNMFDFPISVPDLFLFTFLGGFVKGCI
jgi:hypothetical protein